MKTTWKRIKDAFNEEKIELYPPAYKHGDCEKPYVVCKNDGNAPIAGYSSCTKYYTFILYVPRDRYADLDSFVETVKSVLEKLQPALMSVGERTPDFYDDTYKAHTTSIMYRNNVRERSL